MALVQCPECGMQMSDTIKNCPHCGYKIKKVRPKQVFTKKQKVFAVVLMGIFLVALGIGGFIGFKQIIVPAKQYHIAENYLQDGKYSEAVKQFTKLGKYRDSKDRILEVYYKEGVSLLEEEKFEEAIAVFELAGKYEDSKTKILEAKYSWASKVERGQAMKIYEELGDYKDAKEKLDKLKVQVAYEQAISKLSSAYKACNSTRTKLSSDKLSIMVDSSNKYDYKSLVDIYTIVKKLGLPDSLVNSMSNTNALMGRQTASYGYYNISWTYHPDNGLDVIFEIK